MDETTVTNISQVYEGKGIVEIVVDSFTEMTTGITGGIKSTFDSLVLDDEGRLSMLAIWALVFLGLGFAPRIFKMAYSAFQRIKAGRAKG